MPANRYILTLAPVEHINGKIAPSVITCPYLPEGGKTDGYMYGYRHIGGIRNYYGIRTKCRNLSTNPVTDDEQANRAVFTASIICVNTNLQDPHKRALCAADFDKQTYYTTLRGFAIAAVRANGGYWLDDWS